MGIHKNRRYREYGNGHAVFFELEDAVDFEVEYDDGADLIEKIHEARARGRTFTIETVEP